MSMSQSQSLRPKGQTVALKFHRPRVRLPGGLNPLSETVGFHTLPPGKPAIGVAEPELSFLENPATWHHLALSPDSSAPQILLRKEYNLNE